MRTLHGCTGPTHCVQWLGVFALAMILAACGNADDSRSPGERTNAPVPLALDKVAAGDLVGQFRITASSQTGEFGPLGLLAATPPGWHSAHPPGYPENISIEFSSPRQVRAVALLRQEGQPARAPKAVRVELSDDGKAWTPVAGADNACSPNTPDGWSRLSLAKPATGRYLRVIIFSNCGDPALLTVQGIRLE